MACIESTTEVLVLKAVQYCLQFHLDFIHGAEAVPLQLHFQFRALTRGYFRCVWRVWDVVSHFIRLKAHIKTLLLLIECSEPRNFTAVCHIFKFSLRVWQICNRFHPCERTDDISVSVLALMDKFINFFPHFLALCW